MNPESAKYQVNRRNAVAAVSIGVVVLLGRLFLVSQYGADVPFSDAWIYELREVYQPYLHNTLHLKDFFLRFGEHIGFFLKLVAFVLFYLSGRWDVMLMLKVQTVFAAIAAGFLAYVLPDGREVRWLGLVTLFLLFSGVVGYFNLLVGGQFIFPLSVALACAAFWLWSSPRLDIRMANLHVGFCERRTHNRDLCGNDSARSSTKEGPQACADRHTPGRLRLCVHVEHAEGSMGLGGSFLRRILFHAGSVFSVARLAVSVLRASVVGRAPIRHILAHAWIWPDSAVRIYDLCVGSAERRRRGLRPCGLLRTAVALL
jgi:hypothetical protein